MILGQIFALLTAACWAQNSIVYSLAGKRVGSNAVTHIRLWIALPVIIVINFAFTGTPIPLDLSGSSYLFLSLSGLMGFCLADLFIFRAFVDIGHRETLVIMTTSPIFSTIISWFVLGEVLTLLQISGIALTVAGIGWVLFAENRAVDSTKAERRKVAPGVLFAFAGALAQAAGLTLAKFGMGSEVHPVSANLLRITAGLAGLVIFTAIRGQFFADFRRMKDTKALLYIGIGAVIGPVLGIILTLYALTMAPVGVVTTIMQVSPIMLLPIDKFVFKKRIPIGAVLGTFVAVGGAMLLFV
ncbi:MAG: DMT family transporter [Spirochaetales bacterium]|nr:DMT family transporter [Spirochaetales bacterium]